MIIGTCNIYNIIVLILMYVTPGGSVVFLSAISALVEREQALMGHWVDARSARHLPEPQSQSLALSSLETAAR